MTASALDGVRVLDFSWVVAGPMTTKMLACMGAEVIKVESTLRPEFLNRSSYFPVLNGGKKSITVNISSPAGQDLLRRLVGLSEVVVENFSSKVLRKYGLGYDEMRAVKPDIVFCSASGVGRTGPQADALAYGTLLQGYSGRAGLVGEVNGNLEAMGIVPAWTDPATAMWETLAILAALHRRRRTGEGAYLDLSMLESTVSLMPEALIRAALGDDGPAPARNVDPEGSPSGCFPAAGHDEWIALSARTQAEWQGLCAVMGRHDLARDPKLATPDDRIAARETLNRHVAVWAAGVPAAEAERRLVAIGVPAARTRSMMDVIEDPQIVARGVFPVLPDGSRSIALPWREDDGWRGEVREPPGLGADNAYVFGTLLGLADEEIDRLQREDVIR